MAAAGMAATMQPTRGFRRRNRVFAESTPATGRVASTGACRSGAGHSSSSVCWSHALLGWGGFWVIAGATGASTRPIVVVVPFDVSADAPEAWRPFADQVTRELIRNLRKISRPAGACRAPSAFTFRDDKTRDHIRRQLPDVQYVLDGVVSISAGNDLAHHRGAGRL